MKIGICGAQSTGKTTLAKALAERLGLPLITEQARVVAEKMGIRCEEDLRRLPPEKQIEFQEKCLAAQRDAENRYYSGFVSDRTVVDNAVYWLVWNYAHADLYSRFEYLILCYAWAIQNYDLLVYCPSTIEQQPEDDGFRISTKSYQEEVDFLIETLLLGWELPFIRVEGPVENRVQQVINELKGEELT